MVKGVLLALATLVFPMAEAQNLPAKRVLSENGNYVATSRKSVRKASSDEWQSLGTGKYRDDMMTKFYLVENYEFDVEIQESSSTPGLYRIVSPYKSYPIDPADFEGDTYMEIDATEPDKVFFTRYDTGMDWGDGHIYIASIAGDYYEQYGSIDQAYNEGLCGTLTDGTITFPYSSLLIADDTFGYGTYMQCNEYGKFRIKLPGAPDLDISIVIKDLVDKDGKEYISVDFVLGDDIEKVKVAMVEGYNSPAMVDDIVSGTIPYGEMTGSGEYLFPYEKDGIYTFIAVPYYNGEVKKAEYVTQELSYRHEGWNDIGTAMYTEGFIADCELPITDIDAVTTPVPVQESTEKPGLFRLVDPYGENYYYSTAQDYDYSHHYYMEIDASDPERVVINEMSDGCGWNFGYGDIILWSRAGYYHDEMGYTTEEIESLNLYGKRNGNVITFPENSLLVKFISVVPAWYWANCNGNFKVVLPETAGIYKPDVDVTANDDAEYFTLSGVKVDTYNLRPGIYIKKQGTRSTKIAIR